MRIVSGKQWTEYQTLKKSFGEEVEKIRDEHYRRMKGDQDHYQHMMSQQRESASRHDEDRDAKEKEDMNIIREKRTHINKLYKDIDQLHKILEGK